ncbi:hypothetical protein MVEN_00150400 [Mycena venus]|uniref:F-box domain-containing protein n=1 Tax=Mycena venus TaxID=2733690 RepID=A0A8H7DCW9_9AGAR|nr:hypothetical protein MVEN_00150400 [Mycena venus]
MSLQGLGDDVILKILSLCDVCAVLTISTVNKSFRHLTLTKQLWVHLMHNLVSRGLLHQRTDAEIDAYSARDVIDEIKRIVCGPETWAPTSPCAPAAHREFTFHINVKTDDICHLRLTPGGTHAILQTSEDVRLYDARTGRCLWTKISRMSSIVTDIVDGGEMVRVLLVPSTCSENAEITIQEVNLITGETCEVFNLPMPLNSSPFDRWWCRDLREKFFILHLYLCSIPGGNIFILVDWRNNKQVILTYDDWGSDLKPRLLRDHVLVTYEDRTPSSHHVLALTVFSAFETYWHPLNVDAKTILFREAAVFPVPVNPPIPNKHIPTTTVLTLLLNDMPISRSYACSLVAVYESPLQHDNYKIMLYLTSHAHPFTPHNRLLLTFSCAPNTISGAPLTLQQTSSTHGPQDSYGHEVLSYAGYVIHWLAVPTIVDFRGVRAEARTRGGFNVVKADPGWEKMHFSSSNSAVLGVANGSVTVRYYK